MALGLRGIFFLFSLFHKTLLTKVPIILKCDICEGKGLNTRQDVVQGSRTIFPPSVPGPSMTWKETLGHNVHKAMLLPTFGFMSPLLP